MLESICLLIPRGSKKGSSSGLEMRLLEGEPGCKTAQNGGSVRSWDVRELWSPWGSQGEGVTLEHLGSLSFQKGTIESPIIPEMRP